MSLRLVNGNTLPGMSAPGNLRNRTIYICDNLRMMRGIDDNSVDLIATDPPFNAGRMFSAPIGSKAAGQQFDDRWRWDEVTDEWTDLLGAESGGVISSLIESAVRIEGGSRGEDGRIDTGRTKNSIGAYLAWMAPRIREMHRVLKPTGSIYLHCDHSANAYLRLLLDAIFGRSNFRNEIAWCYTTPGNVKRHFQRKHDTIFFYAKSAFSPFYPDHVRLPYECEYTPKRTPPGVKEGTGSAARHEKGRIPRSWWADGHLSNVSAWMEERTGWPTQKPVALYERMILASTDPGEMVLDPFCGCATTLIAAERQGREWVGCDISEKAEGILLSQGEKLLKRRLWDGRKVVVRRSPPKRKDIKAVSPTELRLELWNRQARRCANPYCDGGELRQSELHLDHRLPKSRGGTDAPSNRIGLCQPCNNRKGRGSWGAFLADERAKQPLPPPRGR